MKQSGEKFSEFLRNLEQQAEQAEMEKLDQDGLFVHIALCNMSSGKLKDKFMVADKLMVAKMRDLVTMHEIAEINKNEDNRVRQTKAHNAYTSHPGQRD